MFFYLSFLKPPPRSVPWSAKHVDIAPQIANDLRTELYEREVDVCYRWTQDLPVATTRYTFSQKLTVWKGAASAYKVIPVPLPSNRRIGDRWRLQLAASSGDDPYVIQLGEASGFGVRIFPVDSEAVVIGGPLGLKQDRIIRHFALPGYTETADTRCQRIVSFVEQTSFDLDKKLWDSGLGLSSWLASILHPDVPKEPSNGFSTRVQALKELLQRPEGFNAVELGTGVGVVALLLAALLEQAPDAPRRLIATDLKTAIPLIQENVARNVLACEAVDIQVATLDWEDPLDSCKPLIHLEPIDIIILADVTYNRDVFPALLHTVSSILKQGNNKKYILMGYKERHSAERQFWEMARDLGLGLERVGTVRGARDPDVEIWIGEWNQPS